MAKAELFQKDIPENERVFYYESEEDDPIKTDEQERKEKVTLPEGYEYIPKNPLKRMRDRILFSFFWVFGQWYERHYWKAKFYGREKLKKARGKGYVMYANHTNPLHDVFGPALAANRKIYTVISAVNLKIPGIGPMLPMIGGIPLGTNDKEKKAMNEAVDKRLVKQKKCLVIYPEAHVWPYATSIRKFPAGGKSFKYATVSPSTISHVFVKSQELYSDCIPIFNMLFSTPAYASVLPAVYICFVVSGAQYEFVTAKLPFAYPFIPPTFDVPSTFPIA